MTQVRVMESKTYCIENLEKNAFGQSPSPLSGGLP